MSVRQNLYFIAIILPKQQCDAITEFKQDIALRFRSKTALKLVPHITLKAPFKLPAADNSDIIQWFEAMPITIHPFHQELKNFGAFHNKRNPVIYVKPVVNSLLQQLQKQVLQNFTRAYPGEVITKQEFDFSPHITIAYRDLQHEMFKAAWHEYRDRKFTAIFEVKNFQLLQHDGKMWNVISNFYLAPLIQ